MIPRLMNKIMKIILPETCHTIYDPHKTYKNFKEIPAFTDYNAGSHLQDTLTRASNLLVQTNNYIPSPEHAGQLLSLLVTLLANNKKLSILDYGGSIGTSYIGILAQSPKSQISYHIVELNETVNFTQQQTLFNKSHDIHFYTSLEKIANKNFDIIYLGSSLQYIEDYAALIKKLCSLNTKHILLNDTIFTVEETFATVQTNVKHKRIKRWIFNFDEIVSEFNNNNYCLAYKTANHDFVDKIRTLRSANLLFIPSTKI